MGGVHQEMAWGLPKAGLISDFSILISENGVRDFRRVRPLE